MIYNLIWFYMVYKYIYHYLQGLMKHPHMVVNGISESSTV